MTETLKEIEGVRNPIVSKVYQQGGGGAGDEDAGDDADNGVDHDEL
jgi:hypothetical protein